MWRILLGGFVVAHGLVTIVMWVPDPKTVEPAPPMDTGHSWLLGDTRPFSLSLAIAAGIVIALAGVGFLTHQGWWSLAGAFGGGLSLALFLLYFTPWWMAGIAISAGLIVAAARAGIPALKPDRGQ